MITQEQSTPKPRQGERLNWLVVNPEGKLLAVLDSESEAYWFTRNRGHAEGAIYFKVSCDYSIAPVLLQTLKDVREVLAVALSWPASDKFRRQINNVIREAEGD